MFVKDRPGHDLRYTVCSTKIFNEFGWRPREIFDTGLRKTVKWYLTNQALVDSVKNGDYRKWIDDNYGERIYNYNFGGLR